MRRTPLAVAVLAVTAALSPALAQDADAVVRLGRLEGQVRQLSGQLEQVQFQNRKLEEQLRKFQADVEFRFQEMKPAPKVAATPASPAPATTGTTVPKSAPPGPCSRPPRRRRPRRRSGPRGPPRPRNRG